MAKQGKARPTHSLHPLLDAQKPTKVKIAAADNIPPLPSNWSLLCCHSKVNGQIGFMPLQDDKVIKRDSPIFKLGSTPSPICHPEPKIAKPSCLSSTRKWRDFQLCVRLRTPVLESWAVWRVWVLLVGTYKGAAVAWESSVVSHGQHGDKGELTSWWLVPCLTDGCMNGANDICAWYHGTVVRCIWCIL